MRDLRFPIKLCHYCAYLFVLNTYFGLIYPLSVFTIFILLILAINPQTIASNFLFKVFLIPLSITIILLLIFPKILGFICSYASNISIIPNGKKLFKEIFIREESHKKEYLYGREIEYQEIYANDEYVLKEKDKRIFVWIIDKRDIEREDFIYKIFIFYSLRINKFLVLLAFPEVIFIPVTLALSQHGSLYVLFLLTFIITTFKKLSILRDDALYIQGNLKYRYKGYIISIENISENVVDMLHDIATESFRTVFSPLKVILGN